MKWSTSLTDGNFKASFRRILGIRPICTGKIDDTVQELEPIRDIEGLDYTSSGIDNVILSDKTSNRSQRDQVDGTEDLKQVELLVPCKEMTLSYLPTNQKNKLTMPNSTIRRKELSKATQVVPSQLDCNEIMITNKQHQDKMENSSQQAANHDSNGQLLPSYFGAKMSNIDEQSKPCPCGLFSSQNQMDFRSMSKNVPRNSKLSRRLKGDASDLINHAGRSTFHCSDPNDNMKSNGSIRPKVWNSQKGEHHIKMHYRAWSMKKNESAGNYKIYQKNGSQLKPWSTSLNKKQFQSDNATTSWQNWSKLSKAHCNIYSNGHAMIASQYHREDRNYKRYTGHLHPPRFVGHGLDCNNALASRNSAESVCVRPAGNRPHVRENWHCQRESNQTSRHYNGDQAPHDAIQGASDRNFDNNSDPVQMAWICKDEHWASPPISSNRLDETSMHRQKASEASTGRMQFKPGVKRKDGALPANMDPSSCPTGRHTILKPDKPCLCIMVKRMIIAQSRPTIRSWHHRLGQTATQGGSQDVAIPDAVSSQSEKSTELTPSVGHTASKTSLPILADFQLVKPTRMIRGGQGTVARVRSRTNGRFYALKFKLREARSELIWEIERREACLLRNFRHQFVVKLYHVYETQDAIFMAQQWLNGGCLWNHIVHIGPVAESYAIYYAACILTALQYLHSRKIVYRDMKAENIVLDSYGRPKLIDFGMAKQLDKSSGGLLIDDAVDNELGDCIDFNQPPTRYYFAAYLAPEIYDHTQWSHELVDSWGLGYIVTEMTLGYGIFLPMPWEELEGQHLQRDWMLQLQTEDVAIISPSCRDFIRKMLIRKPTNRINIMDAHRHEFFQHVPWFKLDKMRGPDLSKNPPRRKMNNKSCKREPIRSKIKPLALDTTFLRNFQIETSH